jgi:hypothetical protein
LKPLMRGVAVAAIVGVSLVFSLAATAGGAGITTCSGVLAPGTYQQVVVPAGAACFSDGPVTIRNGLIIQSGATFVLGSEESAGSTGTISGGVQATDPASVQIHFATINGGIDIQGGSGPFGGPFGVTFNAIEDNQINGAVTIENYDGLWMGFIRNTVNGSVTLTDNGLADEDANEYVTNTIHGSLNCSGNLPAPQVGDSEGTLNQVTGQKTGQCSGL